MLISAGSLRMGMSSNVLARLATRRTMATSWYRSAIVNEQPDAFSDLAYSLSLACKDYNTLFVDLLPKPSALMESQLRLSRGQLNRSFLRYPATMVLRQTRKSA